MDSSLEEIVAVFEKKILGVRNYAHEKSEFFVPDFLNIDELDHFLGQVTNGESDISPAGKVFLEKYYGLEQLAKLLFNMKGNFYREGFFKSEVEMIRWLKEVTPMGAITFIETSRGNINDGTTLREDLLPPKDI